MEELPQFRTNIFMFVIVCFIVENELGMIILVLLPSWRRNIRHLPSAEKFLFCLGDSGSSPL
jgi:hypothetical protein